MFLIRELRMIALSQSTTNEFRPNKNGVILVGGSRVTLDSILTLHRQGATVEEIDFAFDSVGRSNIVAAIEFSLSHPEEVEDYLARRAARAKEVRAENERRFPSAGIRERLEARRSNKS
jgi:uncharacterized protein (DUF433 family)